MVISSGALWIVVAVVLVGATAFACLAAVRSAARLPSRSPRPWRSRSSSAARRSCSTPFRARRRHPRGPGRVPRGDRRRAPGRVPGGRASRGRPPPLRREAPRRRRRARHRAAPRARPAERGALRAQQATALEYHLARVAHWIQYRSVGEYPTGSIRQTALAPGAEYLLVVLQAISGSDGLDALVQLGCWVLVVLSAPGLARLAGAPRAIAAVAAPLAAAAPMALLRRAPRRTISSLSVLAIAVVATSVRCARMRHAVRVPHALLLGVAVAGVLLVKATAAATVLPLLAIVSFATVARAGRAPRAARAAALAVAAGVAVALAALELWRPLALVRVPSALARFTYPPLGEWGDRLVNPVRGVLRHLPAPEALLSAVGPVPFEYASSSLVAGFGALVPHEDFVGNPVHAALALCAVLALATRWRAVSPRGRWAVASLVAAWVLFHAVFRDNGYVSRLQLPLFALWPAFLAVIPRGAWPARLTGASGRRGGGARALGGRPQPREATTRGRGRAEGAHVLPDVRRRAAAGAAAPGPPSCGRDRLPAHRHLHGGERVRLPAHLARDAEGRRGPPPARRGRVAVPRVRRARARGRGGASSGPTSHSVRQSGRSPARSAARRTSSCGSPSRRGHAPPSDLRRRLPAGAPAERARTSLC